MKEDLWVCTLDIEGSFFVKPAYSFLARLILNEVNLAFLKAFVFQSLWKSPAPSKTVVFSWELLHDRIPLGTLVDCVLCDGTVEKALHMFIHCNFASFVWYCFSVVGLNYDTNTKS